MLSLSRRDPLEKLKRCFASRLNRARKPFMELLWRRPEPTRKRGLCAESFCQTTNANKELFEKGGRSLNHVATFIKYRDGVKIIPENCLRRAWWKQNGSGRKMHFDLAADSRSRKVLDSYLKERTIRL